MFLRVLCGEIDSYTYQHIIETMERKYGKGVEQQVSEFAKTIPALDRKPVTRKHIAAQVADSVTCCDALALRSENEVTFFDVVKMRIIPLFQG